ncbi:MAG TPA: transglutaminase family protein [Ohtaekwangia sp.]|uniref:transglutaminase family protein n=1 Tax=Ohtaekwangia sp. TaxID=2066019 RepID=UPI002F9565E1
MSKFKIRHITRYIYEDTVRDSANQLMLYPIRDNFQDVLEHTIQVTSNPMIHIHTDYFGNLVGTFTNAHPHRELIIDSQLMVLTKTRKLPEDNVPADEQWLALEALKSQIEFVDFSRQENFNALPEIQALVNEELSKKLSPLQAAKNLSEYIYKTFEYRTGITTVETTPEEIWKIKSGVCQDFAHILLVMLRLLNIPARYVSGYICPKKNGMRGEGATHAWVEAYIPLYGWLGLDPTNNCVVNETHVRLAVGKNFSDCSPVKGTYRGTSNHTLDVTVSVAYEDGDSITLESIIKPAPPVVTSNYKNSFRRHQEMQMQQ